MSKTGINTKKLCGGKGTNKGKDDSGCTRKGSLIPLLIGRLLVEFLKDWSYDWSYTAFSWVKKQDIIAFYDHIWRKKNQTTRAKEISFKPEDNIMKQTERNMLDMSKRRQNFKK